MDAEFGECTERNVDLVLTLERDSYWPAQDECPRQKLPKGTVAKVWLVEPVSKVRGAPWQGYRFKDLENNAEKIDLVYPKGQDRADYDSGFTGQYTRDDRPPDHHFCDKALRTECDECHYR